MHVSASIPDASTGKHERLVLRGDGLVLREWRDSDIASMVTLFDEQSIDAWTPLPSPFDEAAARRYLARAHAATRSGQGLQLAITTDGEHPLGEVLLFCASETIGELAYAVGVEHRGNALAARAMRLLIDYAAAARGLTGFVLAISAGNMASQRVAIACGFHPSDEPPILRERKGRRIELLTWRRGTA